VEHNQGNQESTQLRECCTSSYCIRIFLLMQVGTHSLIVTKHNQAAILAIKYNIELGERIPPTTACLEGNL